MTTAAAASPAGQRIKRNQTIAYYAAFITLGLTTGALGPALPGLAGNTGSTISQISILFTVQSLGLLIGNLISGFWYDRAPAHPFLAGLVVLLASMLALAPILSTLWILSIVLFFAGVAVGSIDVGGNTLLVWIYRRDVGPFMNALHFFFGLGALISPILVAQTIGATGDITWAYWLLALLIAPVTLFFLRLPSPSAPVKTKEEAAERPRWLLVALISTMFFLFVGAEFSFGGWIYTYALTLELATVTTAGYLTSLFWGALTLGRLLSIPIAARVRPRYMLAGDLVGMVLSLALLLLFPASKTIVWLASFGMGFSIANVFPTMITLGEHHLPVNGNITSWFLVGGSLGSMIIPWLIGQRFETIGPQVTMFILLLAVLLTAGVFAAFLLAVRSPRS